MVKVPKPAICNDLPRKYLKGFTEGYAVTFSYTALLALIRLSRCSRTMS